ncbi:MAG: hypothetical protein ABR575_04100 [Actinomycetota bacterium]
MDLTKLTRGEKLVGASSIALFVLSLFPLWAKYEVGAEGLGVGSSRFNAWSGAYGFYLKLGLILALVAAVLVVVRAIGKDITLPVPLGQVYLGLMGLAALMILIALISGPAGSGFEGFGLEVSRGPMLFVGLALAVLGALGGLMHMRDDVGPVAAPAYQSPVTPPPPPPGA